MIVVIQENRTVDNLFGSNYSFEPGVNIATQGKNGGTTVPLTAMQLYSCYDLGHTNEDFWDMWGTGLIDGVVQFLPDNSNCTATNPQYRFADNGGANGTIYQPSQ